MASNVVRAHIKRAGRGYLDRPTVRNPADYAVLTKDPAIERWMHMRENVYDDFKWSPKTVAHCFILVALIPGSLCYGLTKMIANPDDSRHAHVFPFGDIRNVRRPDPLPPRKPGVKIDV